MRESPLESYFIVTMFAKTRNWYEKLKLVHLNGPLLLSLKTLFTNLRCLKRGIEEDLFNAPLWLIWRFGPKIFLGIFRMQGKSILQLARKL